MLSSRFAVVALTLVGFGCRDQPEIDRWQDQTPPGRALAPKLEHYQRDLESVHQMPDGIVRYRTNFAAGTDGVLSAQADYGNLADGPFFLGQYLASQALRFAVTGEPAAREQIDRSLAAARLLLEASGTRGLLARYVSPTLPQDNRWRRSETHPGYFWRSDVSKDQYAGFLHGLGVTLAVTEDSTVRAQIGELATAIADHLMANALHIVDYDGEPTTHGDLRGRQYGAPFAVDAAIVLNAAKIAAVSSGEARYAAFYRRLIDEDYPRIFLWSNWAALTSNRVNANMFYVSIYSLLRLEVDPEIVGAIRRGARNLWPSVSAEYNALFSLIHASVIGDSRFMLGDGEASGAAAVAAGVEALRLFPADKLAWPVDLIRQGFDFPQRLLRSKGQPRSRVPIPPYLRPRSSSLWVSDPYRLVGRLANRGERLYSGIDFLLAYWIGRYHGFVVAED